MFRHLGQKRSFLHNVRLAALLCLTAGFVNAAGFLSFMVLTTNVTGHAALLAVKLIEGDFRYARMVSLWLFVFLTGAFLSSFYIARTGREKPHAYTLPLIVEMLILTAVAGFGYIFDGSVASTEVFAGSLLFAMGLQNALVSMVSGSVVRTTHLTGMFTDLGIDLSAALLSNSRTHPAIRKRIILRLVIISFFLGGGIFGGFSYFRLGYAAFYIPVVFLGVTIFFDYFRIKWLKVRHRVSHRIKKINASRPGIIK